MANDTKKVQFWHDAWQNTDVAAFRAHLLTWIVPALFALLVSTTIRFHSLFPAATLPRAVGNHLAVMTIALLLLSFDGRRLRLPADVAVLLMAFAASAAISVAGSGDVDLSLLRLELYLVVALMATVLYLVYRDQQRIPLASFCLAAVLLHLPFLTTAVLWIGELHAPFWENGFRVAEFANVRHFGYVGFIAAASGTALGLLSRRLAVVSFIMASAALFGVIMTGSRAGLLSWILFVLLACCFSNTRMRAAVLGALILASSAGLVWYLDRSGVFPSPNIFGRVASFQAGTESFDASRLKIWMEAIGQIGARPLFGSGPEGYFISGCCDSRVLQAHNFVLQFLLEFGVVGCTIAVILVVRVIRHLGGVTRMLQLLFSSQSNRLLACLLAAFLGFSLIDQTMYHLVPLLHFALFVGLLAAGLAHANAGGTETCTADHHR